MMKSESVLLPRKYNTREPSFGKAISFICLLWSLFQLWLASDFPFYLSEITKLNLVFNSQEARQIHLAFGLGLRCLGFRLCHGISRKPALRRGESAAELPQLLTKIIPLCLPDAVPKAKNAKIALSVDF